ncbi:MAG: diaminopimelate decarboxylase [Alphaproteobacteria bacterium]|nr:diaminopimelate decarboxylase [Alphaproteobacteria bacterium]
MDFFAEKNGVLHAEDVPLTELAQEFGTPLYVYSQASIVSQYETLSAVLKKHLPKEKQPLLCYACKANSNIAILSLLKSLGSGLEIVSEGELMRGVKAGFSGQKIISTSFGKSKSEIEACLEADILQFNIECVDELYSINDIAKAKNKNANVLFRINPDIAGGGHDKINTGRKEDKFGSSSDKIIELYQLAEGLDNIKPVGVSIHIGSQVFNVQAFKPAFTKLAEIVKLLRDNGHEVNVLDIGGGFPIPYHDESNLDLDSYAQWVRDIILPLDVDIQMEPGRYMVGSSGVLLSTVEYIKTTDVRDFMVLDAGMNDLIRPALYDAFHLIESVEHRDNEIETYDVVGPICESGDIFAKNRQIQHVDAGDLVVFRSAGAYGFSMASNYNSRPMPAEVLVNGNKYELINKRQSLEEMIQRETVPDWIK